MSKWNKDTLKKEAEKYSSVGEFSKMNRVALEKIQRSGWFDEMCSHLSRKTKERGYWTEETVRLHAKECVYRKEFQYKYNRGYRIAKKLNILDDLFGKINQLPSGYWTEDRIIDAAIEVDGKKELQVKFGGAYKAARRLGILNDLFDSNKKCQPTLWTEEKIREVHDPSETKMQFIKKYAGAASAAKKLNIWDSLNFKRGGSLCKRCIYSIEFEDGSVYIGLTFDFNKRIYDHFNYSKKYSSARKHILKNPKLKYCCIQLSEYMDIDLAAEEEGAVLNIYKKDGWNILNKMKAGGLGGRSVAKPITKSECILSAKKFNTITEWKENDFSSYRASQKNGWIEECKSYMNLAHKPKLYWTIERCVMDAKQYKTKKEWRLNSSGYSTAQKNGWMEICCKHMVNGRIKWTKKDCLRCSSLFSTRNEWRSNDPCSYGAAIRNGWLEECCLHMNKVRKVWTKDKCIQDAKKYQDRSVWKAENPSAYRSAIRNKWLNECCSHMKQPNSWTKENCILDAKKYKSKTEWRKGSGSAYIIAGKNNWIDECCGHMEILRKKRSKSECMEDALKYTSRSKWKNNSRNIYQAALRGGWLDDCCKHM